MTLEELRREIDRVDGELIPLFCRRMELAKQVAAVKKAAGLPLYHPGREGEILSRAEDRAGEYGPYLRQVYAALFEASRALQQQNGVEP